MTDGEGREATVACLLLFGDLAELVHDGAGPDEEPARWPVLAIMADTGLAREAVAGRRFRVLVEEGEGGPEFSGFRLVT